MAAITFRTKVQTMHDMEGNELYRYIVVPELKRSHCDMHAFRNHSKYGPFANSDLFKGMLARIRSTVLNGNAYLKMDDLPSNVTVDDREFLALVTIEV